MDQLTEDQILLLQQILLNVTSTSQFDSGDTAWLMISTVLVLFMTLPGLILYYIGMIRKSNVISTAMHVFSIACLITTLWFFLGYSLAFSPAGTAQVSSPVYGDTTRAWLLGLDADSVHQLAPTVPEPVFCVFQLAFAIITPALIWGSIADRMKFESLLIFIGLWHFLVYCPVAHSVWHPDGFLFKAGVLDFAGGTVVHITAGISGLIATILIKPRIGLAIKNNETLRPHSIQLTICGSCMLWIGWFGFNAGSAVAADGRATMAFLNTFLSAAFATLSWLAVDWTYRGESDLSLPPPLLLSSHISLSSSSSLPSAVLLSPQDTPALWEW
jgi:ammonium transporter, Amt family